MAGLLSLVLVVFVLVQSGPATATDPSDPHLTCFVTPPVRDPKSVKPITLTAVRTNAEVVVSMAFSGRDEDGIIYSDGQSVEFGEIMGAMSTAPISLLVRTADLNKPEKEYLEPGRFGVHYCDLISGSQGLSIRAPLLIHNQRTLIPRDGIRTYFFSAGDTMELCVDSNLPKTWRGPIEWAFNGERPSWIQRFTGSTCIRIKDVQTCQAGIYEAYRRICGRRVKQHAFFDVRVRSCPDGRANPPLCDGTCVACEHGHCADNGACICANGFMGTMCETTNQDHFGYSLDVQYDQVLENASGKGSLVCSEGAGCSCTNGWKGIACDQECDALSYGPDCAFPCDAEMPCDRFTGAP